MNTYAHEIVSGELTKLASLSYAQLKQLTHSERAVGETQDSEGNEYQVEKYACIDDQKAKTIRVVVSVYQPRTIAPWWQFWKNIDKPIAHDDFIIRPDGSFLQKPKAGN